MSLCALGLAGSGGHSRRPHHLGRAGRRLPQARRGGRWRYAWAFLDRDHAMRQAEAADEQREAGPVGPLHGVPIGIKDIFDTGDMPTEIRLAAVGGPHAAPRRGGGGASARGRRRDHGQDRDDGMYLFHPGKTRNPHDPPHPGRLVERLGGGSRSRHGAGRDRLADQRLGDPAGGVLRRGRLQADAGSFRGAGALMLSRTLDHVGVFARSVEDAALLAETLVGFDEEDPDTRPVARPVRGRGWKRAAVAAALRFVRSPAWSTPSR